MSVGPKTISQQQSLINSSQHKNGVKASRGISINCRSPNDPSADYTMADSISIEIGLFSILGLAIYLPLQARQYYLYKRKAGDRLQPS